jgi:hypothetical protein
MNLDVERGIAMKRMVSPNAVFIPSSALHMFDFLITPGPCLLDVSDMHHLLAHV